MVKGTIRIMGHFEQVPHSPVRVEPQRHCKGCGKPVRETVGNSGYCKKCIALARQK